MIKAIQPAMCDLPTRLSVGCLYVSQATPDEQQQCCSLPQKYYIASFVGWKDGNAEREPRLRKWMSSAFKEAERVGCGMYIADYDHTQRQSRVMTRHAEESFAKFKRRYDPGNIFSCVGFSFTPDMDTHENPARI